MSINRSILLMMVTLILGTALLAAAQATPARLTKIKVTAEQANLREKPDIGSSIVQQIPEGTILEADKKEGEWFFVRYTLEDGGVIGGYIHESLVEVVEAGEPVRETKTGGKELPARERVSRPIRIGKIKMPDLSTGGLPLEFSVSVGIGSIAPRDLNDGTRGYADWNGAELGIATPGAADVLHLAALAGFELSYKISPRLAIGLGADYFRGANRGLLEYTDPLVTETLVTRPAARAVPVKLSVRFYPGAGFYVRAGLGICAVKASYLYRHERTDSWEQWKGSATTSGLVGEAAFGGEWDIAPQTSFFAEAGFRMASFRALTGKNVTTNSGGAAETEPGTLYFFHKTGADAGTYALLFVRGSAPAEEGVTSARRADVNLSGTAIRVGIRYRF
jgi:hypothetical protein